MESQKFISTYVQGERIIYTPSSFAKLNLIYLQEIGISSYTIPHASKRTGNASFLFFLVLDGKGNMKYQNSDYILEKGKCVFINCGLPYTLSTYESLWKLAWIHFSGNNMLAIHEKFIERCGGPCFLSSEQEEFYKIHRSVYQSAIADSNIRDMLISEKLFHLVVQLMEKCWKRSNSCAFVKGTINLPIIKKYIDVHYSEKINLDSLANKFFINKYYLTRCFKKYYAVSIWQYIISKRITVVKQLLRFSDKSIADIAENSGFNDASYMSRVFKSIEGVSPSVFKEQWKAKTTNEYPL